MSSATKVRYGECGHTVVVLDILDVAPAALRTTGNSEFVNQHDTIVSSDGDQSSGGDGDDDGDKAEVEEGANEDEKNDSNEPKNS
jgi:hypothetical protein